MGVWIETLDTILRTCHFKVTPFVGVWIETNELSMIAFARRVTPFVGVWIETLRNDFATAQFLSHPSWVCGLKQMINDTFVHPDSHTLRGCVD